ncbi:MAG: response regulator [Agathobacter sp.]
MKTAETINIVCTELGISKSDLAKKMGMLPSSLYRKLSRESMTLEELQKCLDVLGVTMEFNLKYPDGKVQSSQVNYEMLLERMDMLETELEAEKKVAEFHKKSLKDLRTELSTVVGYAELSNKNDQRAEEYLKKLKQALTNMELTIAYALGETVYDEPALDEEKDNSDIDLLAGRRVLLVDDNDMNREIMKEILSDRGLVVEEADDGKSAVEKVKEKEPGFYQFVLMDIEMPVMDGYEATMRIRELPNRMRANVPIIALTANAFPENRMQAEEVGMDDFLVKPVNSSRLLRSLAKFL